MHIAIIGAGVAGPAAALALHRAGHAVAAYEAHPDRGADIGAFLTLASTGMHALRELDAAEAVAAAGFPLTVLTVLAPDGSTVISQPLGDVDNPLTQYRCLRRADLGEILRAEVHRRNIPLIHNARLSSITEDGSAHFTNGTSVDADLIIGADGLNSTVRALTNPVAPTYVGQRVFYGYTTAATPPGDSHEITMIRGTEAAFGYAISPDGETYWFARVTTTPLPDADAESTTPTTLRDYLVPLLAKDNTPAADIVAATDDQLMVTNAHDLPTGIPWHTPHTLLIGDAAHAASPATGQGASMALQDAVALANALRPATPLSEGLAAYEATRRAPTETNIRTSRGMTARSMPAATDRGNPAE